MAEYNWFMYSATRNLLALCGIDNPTTEQIEQAEHVVRDIRGYVRSL